MKRIILLTVILFGLILSLLEIYPVLAYEVMLRWALPWKVEHISQDHVVVNSVSTGFDYYNRAPMAVYSNSITHKFRSASFVGNGQGTCDMNADWKCADIYSPAVGEYNDVANYKSADNTLFAAGIVYYDQGANDIIYQFAYRDLDDGDGSATYNIYSLGPGSTIGSQPSLALDADGNAHIAFIEESISGYYLIYIHEVKTAGNNGEVNGLTQTWETKTIFASSANIADDPSIAISANGNPRIAYYDPVNGALGFAYPASLFHNCGGGEWRCIAIDSQMNTGKHPAIAIDEATYIAYYNNSTGDLWVAKFVGSGGNCGNDYAGVDLVPRWQCEVIDNVGAGNADMAISLVVDGLEPIVAYSDANDYSHTSLKLAQTASRLGMDYGNCGPENTWYCQTIDRQQNNLGSDIDMVISPSGVLHIAYLEEWMTDIYRLWFARQFLTGYLPLLSK